jgi:hypothetical protein
VRDVVLTAEFEVTVNPPGQGPEVPIAAKLAYYPVERINARGTVEVPGQPTWWYLAGVDTSTGGLKIRLYPLPADEEHYIVKVYGVGRPLTLGDTDFIPVPEDFLIPLRHGVRARVYLNQNDLQSAQVSQTTYQGLLAGLNARFSGPQPSTSRLAVKRMRGLHQAPAAVDGS